MSGAGGGVAAIKRGAAGATVAGTGKIVGAGLGGIGAIGAMTGAGAVGTAAGGIGAAGRGAVVC